jgi:hypothetical protein
MRNVEMSVSNNKLTIVVDLSVKGEVSGSGKSNVLGTTEGNVSVPGHEHVKIGLNVYTKKGAAA